MRYMQFTLLYLIIIILLSKMAEKNANCTYSLHPAQCHKCPRKEITWCWLTTGSLSLNLQLLRLSQNGQDYHFHCGHDDLLAMSTEVQR